VTLGKSVNSLCLRNAGLDEAQAGIKIAGLDEAQAGIKIAGLDEAQLESRLLGWMKHSWNQDCWAG